VGLCRVSKIGNDLPKVPCFISFIDGDSQEFNPKIIFESIGNIFRCCKGKGRDRKDYVRSGHTIYYVSGTI